MSVFYQLKSSWKEDPIIVWNNPSPLQDTLRFISDSVSLRNLRDLRFTVQEIRHYYHSVSLQEELWNYSRSAREVEGATMIFEGKEMS
ncbi:hypothetical protein MUP77_19475 [Candidatus Bathyarchaeota archaeon]|nr:hypothetical protein [Candidatus Bathyarchaeota archaeon]